MENMEDLAHVGAIITDSHVVYTSGKHGSAYVNKDAVYPHTRLISAIALDIAEKFKDDDVEVVAAPAVGGLILAQWVAHHLTELTGRDVLAVYAEHVEVSLYKAKESVEYDLSLKGKPVAPIAIVTEGDEILIKKQGFHFKRGYGDLVKGKRVLCVEDILTTGLSARGLVDAVWVAGATVIALAALCNRGGLTERDFSVPRLYSYLEVELEMHEEENCPLCAAGVPINTKVGKGKAFLARQAQKS